MMAKPCVLIVDDQHDVRRVLRAGLESLARSFNIIDVPSGEEALLVIKRQPIDLLVADIRLPGISGLELKERALLHNPNLKLILITGLVDPNMRREVSAAGAEAVFYKPIELGDFLETVQVCLFSGGETPPGSHPDLAPERPQVTRRTARAKVEPAGTGLRYTAREDFTRTPVPAPARSTAQQPALEAAQPAQGKAAQPVHPPSAAQDPAGRLAELRYEVDAVAVVLLDANGRVALQTGNPGEISSDRSLMFAIRAALEAGARMSRSLGAKTLHDFQYFAGRQYDLFLAHLGERGALALVVRGGSGEAQIPRVAEAVACVSHDLAGFLETLPQAEIEPEPDPTPPSPPPAVEEALDLNAVLPELDRVFNRSGANGFKTGEVDAFWDNVASGSSGLNVGDQKALSYEEARKLGLSLDGEAG